MKFQKFGVLTAMIAAAAFVGCSSDQTGDQGGEKDASLSFNLTNAQGVVITSVDYDLNTSPGGANVADGAIPVPNPDSTISVGINSLPPGSYSLAFSATGMYNGASVPCVSTPSTFSLAAGQALTLPTVTLTCTITVPTGDNTGSIAANVNVAVEQISVNGNNVEVFSYGPRSVTGHTNMGGACVYPPVALKVFNNDPTITYGWTASNGTLALNATNTLGTYTCTSGGSKTLTITATKGGLSNSKSVTVECVDACGVTGPVCNNGVVEAGEQCDENTLRCQNCAIVPVCGDNVVDAPEQCDAVALPTATCSINCVTIAPAVCGNGVVEGDEQCDALNLPTATCAANCTTIVVNPPVCGNGVVEGTEECDALNLPTATCTITCTTIVPPTEPFPLCDGCISASADLGPFQQELCVDGDPTGQCLAIETCLIDSGCYLPIPGRCYCGSGPTDLDNCTQPTFVPAGPCATLIRTATGNGTNAETLERAVQLANPSGVAHAVVDEATRQCRNECFAP